MSGVNTSSLVPLVGSLATTFFFLSRIGLQDLPALIGWAFVLASTNVVASFELTTSAAPSFFFLGYNAVFFFLLSEAWLRALFFSIWLDFRTS